MMQLIYDDFHDSTIIKTASFPRACNMAQGFGVAKVYSLHSTDMGTGRITVLCDIGAGDSTTVINRVESTGLDDRGKALLGCSKAGDQSQAPTCSWYFASSVKAFRTPKSSQ